MDNRFVERYSELLLWRPVSLRDIVRSVVLKGLIFKNAISNAREKYNNIPRVQFINIHHVFKDEENHLEILLETLSKDFEFISYSDAVSKILSSNIDKPYIVFTSDDGLKNNLKAAEILGRYNAKACFFINPGLIGEKDYSKIEQHCRQVLDFPIAEFLDWKDIELLQSGGHEIGGHTMNHINIAKATQAVIAADAEQTLAVLNQHCGQIKHFAFPYGRFIHFSEAGRKAIFEAGYSSCASAERGCHINPDSPLNAEELCIRRDHIILAWGIDQILYFIINNAKNAASQNNLFPALLK